VEGILVFLKMEEIDLIINFEKISSKIANRVLKLEGFIFKGNKKEKLEIIIFRGFSSSTTHPIEIDLEKKVLEIKHSFFNFKLFKAPLTKYDEDFIRENNNPLYFLKEENWI